MEAYMLKRKGGHALRRNCLLKHFTEIKIDGTIKRGRRHKQLLDDPK
jgi:hypothetical protein